MFSRTAEYALRAATALAIDPSHPKTTKQIAEQTQVPSGYLSKVMQSLVDAGLATSQRGLGGGFLLAVQPDKLSMLSVVNAVDPIDRIRACPLDLKSHRKKLCLLHRTMDDIIGYVEATFSKHMIGDLVSDAASPTPLCDVPTAVRQASLGNGFNKRRNSSRTADDAS